jgi:hypothetical protein
MFRPVSFKGKVTYDYIDEADHTYTLVTVRRRMEEMVIAWVVQHFANEKGF